MAEDSEVLTVDPTINLLTPARRDWIEAEGVVLRSGRTLGVCRSDMWAIEGDRRTPIAVGQQTVIRAPASQEW